MATYRKWSECPCGETQTMSHIVESCPLTKLNGGLSRLHSADEDAVSWLTSYGSWNAYEKKKKYYTMSQKTVHFSFCQNFIKFPWILISFGKYFGHITRGSAGQLALTVLEGIMEGTMASRQTEKTVDTRHWRVDWLRIHSTKGDVTRSSTMEEKDIGVVVCCRQPSSRKVD